MKHERSLKKYGGQGVQKWSTEQTVMVYSVSKRLKVNVGQELRKDMRNSLRKRTRRGTSLLNS